MKRVIAVFLILAVLFPALLLPAAAAEPEEYVFERMEAQFYETAVPVPGEDYFVLYDYLQPGMYQLRMVFYPEVVSAGVNFTLFNSMYYVSYHEFNDPRFGLVSRCEFLIDGVLKLGNSSFSGAASSIIYALPDDGLTLFFSGSDIMPYVQHMVLTKAYTVNDELDFFFFDLATGLMSLSGTNLITVILVTLGIVTVPVLLWFGYRYVKRKVVVSFRKGKV